MLSLSVAQAPTALVTWTSSPEPKKITPYEHSSIQVFTSFLMEWKLIKWLRPLTWQIETPKICSHAKRNFPVCRGTLSQLTLSLKRIGFFFSNLQKAYLSCDIAVSSDHRPNCQPTHWGQPHYVSFLSQKTFVTDVFNALLIFRNI